MIIFSLSIFSVPCLADAPVAVGCVVETAIKHETGGEIRLDQPLTAGDIGALTSVDFLGVVFGYLFFGEPEFFHFETIDIEGTRRNPTTIMVSGSHIDSHSEAAIFVSFSNFHECTREVNGQAVTYLLADCSGTVLDLDAYGRRTSFDFFGSQFPRCY